MARRHKNVLLIDLDLKKPALYKLLDCQQEKFFPLEIYLAKGGSADALIRHDAARGIDTILSRKGAGSAADLLGSDRLRDLLAQMRERMVDTAILVVRQDQAPVRALNDCIDVLRRSDAEVLGCVFNNAYAASIGDRQSYGYGYGYDYGYGYGARTEGES